MGMDPPPGDSHPLQIKAKLMELLDKRKVMMELWQQRWDRLRLCKCDDGRVGGQGGCLGLVGPPRQLLSALPPLPAVLEVCQFSRDASVAESWLVAQEPYLASSDYGQTVDGVEKLLKRHEAFEKSTATWEERIAALRKLTTVRKAQVAPWVVVGGHGWVSPPQHLHPLPRQLELLGGRTLREEEVTHDAAPEYRLDLDAELEAG